MLFSTLANRLSENYPGITYEVPCDCELEDIVTFPNIGTPNLPENLFLLSPTQISGRPDIPPSILCLGDADKTVFQLIQDSGVNYIVVPTAVSTEVFLFLMNEIRGQAQQQKLYSAIMDMLYNGTDLETIFCKFRQGTGFQAIAIDVSGKILAVSRPFVITQDHWQSSVDQGYLDQYIIDFIHRRRAEGNNSMSTVPFIRYCNINKLHVKGIRVIKGGELIGYVFIGGKDNVFPQDSDRLLRAFSKAVDSALFGSRELHSHQVGMHQSILSDLIDGISEEEALQRIRSAKMVFPNHMRVLVIRNSFFRGKDYLTGSLLSEFSSLMPTSPKFIKNGNIVVLLEVLPSGEIHTELHRKLSALAKDQLLRIGISNTFTQAVMFATFYSQAIEAQTVARRSGDLYGLFFFSDYAFFIMLSGTEDKELLRQVCLPVLEDIEKYDNEKNAELYETLRVYAQTGFNKNKTAERMFLHRNTINYRIQQLEDLFAIDFSDPTLLFKLQYSFYVDLFLKHRYAELLVSR